MANFNLSVDVFPQRIAASQLRQREGDELFALSPVGLGQTCSQEAVEERSHLGMGIKRDRSRGSSSSARTSNASRRSSCSSQLSNTQFRLSSNVVQATPPRIKQRKMASYSSLRSNQNTFTERGDQDWVTLHTPFGMSNFEADTSRSQSPRRSFPIFTREKEVHSRPSPFGPLDRFLEQNDSADVSGKLEQLGEEQNRVRLARVDGLRLRTRLRDKRKELQEKRLAKSAADDAFMKHVREGRSQQLLSSVAQASHDTTLDTLYEAMQTTRDEYGEAEFAYNQLEDLVDEHEFSLAKMEGRLYNTKIYDVPELQSTNEYHPPAPESLLGMSDGPEEYHQFHINFLTRLGDLDLIKERYNNMVEEKDNLLFLQESRAHLGIDLQEHEKAFLADFPSQEAALLGEMLEIEEDVERWKTKCLAEGIELGEEGIEIQNESHADSESLGHDHLVNFKSTHSSNFEPSMFPVLLPESDEDKVKLGVLITDFDEGNKSDRINRWMRYQLQTSVSEVELLARVFLHFLGIFNFSQWGIDLYKWQLSVLFWWPRDAANKSSGEFTTAHTNSSAVFSFGDSKRRGRHFSKLVANDTESGYHNSVLHRRTRSAPVAATTRRILDDRITARAAEV